MDTSIETTPQDKQVKVEKRREYLRKWREQNREKYNGYHKTYYRKVSSLKKIERLQRYAADNGFELMVRSNE